MTLHLASLALLFTSTILASAAPVARWDFGAEETSRLTPNGSLQRDVPGPRPPEFPDFEASNTAVQFDGSGAHFSFANGGRGSDFEFTNGDSITLEAWVKLDDIKEGETFYIIGKGRTGAAGFAPDNQNWALRVCEVEGRVCLSFLFATPHQDPDSKSDAHWHRWITKEGFSPNSGWHHIALTYRFGTPTSVRGWLDGKLRDGTWDMGGATTEAPVVDDDAIWIGSSKGGAPQNSFRGTLDAVAVHREIVGDELLEKRFRKTGEDTLVAAVPAAEVAPDLGPLADAKVLVTFHEAMPAEGRWLNEGETWPPETARWSSESFLLPRLPLRHDEWGSRSTWKAPLLVRLAADVELPPGHQRFLVRARGLSRLWVNGRLVARTVSRAKLPPDGEEEIIPVTEPPLPGARPAGYWQQEVFGEGDVPESGKCRVILEILVGGAKHRAETGELCVAVQAAEGAPLTIVLPAGRNTLLPLTDAAVQIELAQLERNLSTFDDANRRRVAANHDAFWRERHNLARAWAGLLGGEWDPKKTTPPVNAADPHPVDAFLADKVRRALAEAAKTPIEEAEHFHSAVLPILREECFRCHGEKDKGALRLNTRAAALRSGESKKAAVVPGNAAASELLRRINSKDEDERMPPKGSGLLPQQITALEEWIKSGAAWPAPPVRAEEVAAAPALTDAGFLRRVWLDVVGIPPDEMEVRAFVADKSEGKRLKLIDRLLADERWADHWMPYWLDVLAENPSLINPTLNTTGPFRWFLYDALRDNKPMDRLVTELIMMRGSPHTGGSAGFSLAGENDAPFATKGQIVAGAFLGIELQCARCHDSPYHSTKQQDLFALSAMLERKPVTVPKTSTVPAAFFEKKARESLIKATLKPGVPVAPIWPFGLATGSMDSLSLDALLQSPSDTRERLAALITGPQNTRFAEVLVNRVWRRFLGAGFVEPVADWEGRTPSHPELLHWLSLEFLKSGYDLKALSRLILTSKTYQRMATGANIAATPELRFFNAPERRRLTAEQVVDSLFAATGQPLNVEELTFDPTGRRPEGARITLGKPTRAWMFASLTNERDRPSLSLPRAQCVTDVLEAFGWSGARQAPRTDRETAPNVLQPGVLENSTLSVSLTRASYLSPLAALALQAESPEALVELVFLRFLGRTPSLAESSRFAGGLRDGFAQRQVPDSQIKPPKALAPLPRVTWYNHLRTEATTIAQQEEQRARTGPPPDPRLEPEWRETFEDFVWSILNIREFVWLP